MLKCSAGESKTHLPYLIVLNESLTLSDETFVSPKYYLLETKKSPLFQLDDDAFFGIIQSFQRCKPLT